MGDELPKHLMWQNFVRSECYRDFLKYAEKVLNTARDEMESMEDDEKANKKRRNIKYAREFLGTLKSMANRLTVPQKQ